MKKYAKYMKDVQKFISPYHNEEKPLETFTSMLTHVGLKISHIEIRDQIFIYENVELLKCKMIYMSHILKISITHSFIDSVKAVNPFTSRMPENLQDEFLDDYVEKIDNLNLIRIDEKTLGSNIYAPYKLMIAIASK